MFGVRVLSWVSIPQWCDLNAVLAMPIRIARKRFNPTVVRFEPAPPLGGSGDCRGFNPTVVRFEPPPWHKRAKQRRGFNPTVVRFEHPRGRDRTYLAAVSIPQWCDLNVDVVTASGDHYIRFNPTVVRFEHFVLMVTVFDTVSFNPTVVRFEHEVGGSGGHAPPRFNPTVVRFERPRGGRWTGYYYLFQSHSGAI